MAAARQGTHSRARSVCGHITTEGPAALITACAALACDIWLLSSSWPSLPLLACVVAAALAAISAFDRRVVGLVIAFAYVSPALIRILHGGAPYAPYAALWMSALVGAMMPQAIRTSWHIPAPWRAVKHSQCSSALRAEKNGSECRSTLVIVDGFPHNLFCGRKTVEYELLAIIAKCDHAVRNRFRS